MRIETVEPPKVKELLTPADFVSCPVWLYDEAQEAYREVRGLEGLHGELYDLHIQAVFTSPSGIEIAGEIVGVENIFAIGLFANDEIVVINRNMRSDSRKQVARFLEVSGLSSNLTFDSLFPLRYRSMWGNELFSDFEGVFERPA